MKINRTVLSIAIVYNIVNFLLWQHILTMQNATSLIYVIIFPVFWIIAIVVVAILALKNKAIWFQKGYKAFTIIGLFFCTPIFFMFARSVQSPGSYCDSSGYITKKGYTIKYESWTYNTGSRQVIKYWKSDEQNCNPCDSSHFKRDSTWVYFNKKKDTVKVETYKNGKVISERK